MFLLDARGSTSYTVHSSDCVSVEHTDFGKERVADGTLNVGRGTHALPASRPWLPEEGRKLDLPTRVGRDTRTGAASTQPGTRFYLTDQVQTDMTWGGGGREELDREWLKIRTKEC